MKKILFLPILLLPFLFVGCKLFGTGAAQPNSFETNFFALSNAVIPRVVQQTNTVYQTNYTLMVVTVTNQVNGTPTIVTLTNMVPVYQTNQLVTTATNYVTVPQLVPGAGSGATTGVVDAVGSLFGVGGLATTILAGLFAAYLKARNNALAGNADAATQTNSVLAQNIQTVMSVLTATPQGQALLPQVKAYLMKHQAEAGVIEQVAEAVKTVDPLKAQDSAQAIIDALNRIKTADTQPADPKTGLQPAKPA